MFTHSPFLSLAHSFCIMLICFLFSFLARYCQEGSLFNSRVPSRKSTCETHKYLQAKYTYPGILHGRWLVQLDGTGDCLPMATKIVWLKVIEIHHRMEHRMHASTDVTSCELVLEQSWKRVRSPRRGPLCASVAVVQFAGKSSWNLRIIGIFNEFLCDILFGMLNKGGCNNWNLYHKVCNDIRCY